MKSQSLREEIEQYLIDMYSNAETIQEDDIIEIIEKRIDELRRDRPADLYRAYNAALDDVKEMLK